MARQTLLTPEVQQKIIDALFLGNFFEIACEVAGVSARTGYEWRQRGEGRAKHRPCNEVYAQFAHAVSEAEHKAEQQQAARFYMAGKDDWRAAAEFLARRYPERWSEARRHKVEAQGEVRMILGWDDDDSGKPNGNAKTEDTVQAPCETA